MKNKRFAVIMLALAIASVLCIPQLAFASEQEGLSVQDSTEIDNVNGEASSAEESEDAAKAVASESTSQEAVLAGNEQSGQSALGNGESESQVSQNEDGESQTTTDQADGNQEASSQNDTDNAPEASAPTVSETTTASSASAVQENSSASDAETVLPEASTAEENAGNEASNEESESEENELTTQATSSSSEKAPSASITYRAHVQKKGWLSWVKDGSLSGTSGKSLRMEAFQVKLIGASGGVQCQAHVQQIGWQDVVTAGKTVGTSGKSYRIEALRILLTGEVSKWYDVYYRAHVQSIGWQDWVKNGSVAGTSGKSLRIEAIEIELREKSQKAASATDGIVGVRYRDHVQNVGWQGYVQNGANAGTTGKGLRVEAFKVDLDTGIYTGSVKYRAHVQKQGWQGWKTEDAIAGTTGKGLRVEAFEMALTGQMAQKYDILYRAHVQNIGWQPWAINGGTSGTSGKGLRVEAMQVKLIKKGTSQVISEGTYFIASAKDPNAVVAVPNSSEKAGVQMQSAAFDDSFADRYYIQNEGSGLYTVRSVTSGLYLADSSGKVVQQATSTDKAQRWKATWNGGYSFVNASTGKAMALTSGKTTAGTNVNTQASSTAKTQHWTLTPTSLIPQGTYIFISVASGNVMGVSGAKRTNSANVVSQAAHGGNSQKFTITHLGNEVYSIRNVATTRAVEVKQESKDAGANVQMYSWHTGVGQKWKAKLTGAKSFQFVNVNSGCALTVGSSSSTSESNVYQAKANASSNMQQFTLASTSRIKEVVNIGVPVVMQNPELPTGCESVALTEALKYYGFKLSKTTIADKYMPWSNTDFVYSFLGNPHTSYGAMICAPGIANTANKFLKAKNSSLRATAHKGLSFESLLTYIDRGVPVVVWNTMYMHDRGVAQASSHGYTMYSYTHAVTISGYDPFKKKVLISDPLSGSVWRNQARFKYLYNQMGKQSVTIE